MKIKERPYHYVDNNLFTKAMTEWSESCRNKLKSERPPMSNFIGECIVKIVRGYSSKSNFSGYTYIDDMRSEAVLTCVKYAHNFDSKKSNNAFAYFTQITHHAFTQQLNREKGIARMKFQMAKDLSPKLAKRDFNDIDLWHEEDYNKSILT